MFLLAPARKLRLQAITTRYMIVTQALLSPAAPRRPTSALNYSMSTRRTAASPSRHLLRDTTMRLRQLALQQSLPLTSRLWAAPLSTAMGAPITQRRPCPASPPRRPRPATASQRSPLFRSPSPILCRCDPRGTRRKGHQSRGERRCGECSQQRCGPATAALMMAMHKVQMWLGCPLGPLRAVFRRLPVAEAAATQRTAPHCRAPAVGPRLSAPCVPGSTTRAGAGAVPVLPLPLCRPLSPSSPPPAHRAQQRAAIAARALLRLQPPL